MKKILKWLGIGIACLLGFLIIAFIFFWYTIGKDIHESSIYPCKDTTAYTTIADALAHKETACKVVFDNQRLTSIPSELKQLPHLRMLIMPKNALNSFPKGITELRTLRHLDLSDNNLGSIPPSIGNLKELQVLSLNNTNISYLPDEIGHLPKLQFIDLSQNHFTQEPEVLKNHPNRQKRIGKLIFDYSYQVDKAGNPIQWK